MKDFKYIIALSVLMLAGSMSCYSEESRGVSSPGWKTSFDSSANRRE